MPAEDAQNTIRLRGVRQNNLKNFDLDLPTNQLIVITGLSGSGKSSLAFETLYAEGQRRYIETFSPYARQFFDRMDKPAVDSIHGIPPAIALEQRNAVRTTRSTVGTMTEICDYMKAVWPHLSSLFCKNCGRPVRKDSPRAIWDELAAAHPNAEALVTFRLPLSEKISLAESLELLAKQGYQRLVLDNEVIRLDEVGPRLQGANALVVAQDRIKLEPKNRARFIEACEQAYHFGKGGLCVRVGDKRCFFSNRLHCAECDIEYREPSPALFSFNNPVGACPACKGFGRIISIDYRLAIPDRSKTLAEGAIKPWQTETGAESQRDMTVFCKRRKVPMNVPFQDLTPEQQAWVLDGDPNYGKDENHQWPKLWYGVKGYFKWLESKAYKMHVRVLLSRYRAYTTCPECHGKRFKPDALLYKSANLHLADFYQLPVRRALEFIDNAARAHKSKSSNDPFLVCLGEVRSRLGYLDEVGLGYLTLDRPTKTLSGGETERVNLTTCLGSRLVNTLFVLDEPSVGLHPRDTDRLVKILDRLRSTGNTVVVVEHEPAVMRAADQIIDLGPGHGETGGQLIFQGAYKQILRANSLTGQWLSGARKSEPRPKREVTKETPRLAIANATLHNLKNFAAEIPLGRFVAVTGVSGSGKSTLVREILHPLLEARFGKNETAAASEETDSDSDESESTGATQARLTGAEHLGQVILVDQTSLGRTPRSNPAVYVGAFEHMRDLFADSDDARRLGLGSSSFSFNSKDGQCERCRGAGFEKIEMQFLSDIFVRCPDCQGRRFRPHVLEARVTSPKTSRPWTIADILDATVEDAAAYLREFDYSRPAKRAATALAIIEQVGLGYLRAGQPINTLSGGESQRLKLASHLAEFATRKDDTKPTLFIFDEPTTGLHFEDIHILLKSFQQLVDAGHSLIVVEHNLQVIQAADWLLDLGPDAGDQGGQLIFSGPPEALAKHPTSLTAAALRH